MSLIIPGRPRRAAWPRTASLAVLAAILGGATALADPAPPFAQLLTQSQTDAPRLAEAQAGVAQAAGLRQQAGARPNPEVSLDVENFAGRGPYRGLDGAETTFGVGQSLEWPGKRASRIAAGDAEVVAARARAAQAKADFGYDLANAYAEAEGALRRVELADEALKLALDDERVARALVDAGREAEVRFVQAQSAVSAARAERDAAQVDAQAALARLTALSGSPVPFTSLSASLLEMSLPALEGQEIDVSMAPPVMVAEAEREAAARRVRVEAMRGRPDVTASVGVRRFGGDDTTALVAGLSAPLPLFDRNQGNTNAARADLTAAEARLRSARLNTEADVRVARSQLAVAESRVAAAEQGEAAALEAYRLTRLGYEGGKLPLSEVVVARRNLAAARSATIEARLARVRAEASAARLQGRLPFGDQP